LKNLSKDELLQKRFEKYLNYGSFKEAKWKKY
jgi:acetyl-CoA carboxylase carboxyl transferase subunit alpha